MHYIVARIVEAQPELCAYICHADVVACTAVIEVLILSGSTAVRLLMPGELSKHAVTEGTKAVTKATKDA